MARFVTQDKAVVETVKTYRAATVVERDAKEAKDDAKTRILEYMDKCGVEVMEAGRSLVTVTRYTSAKFNITQFKKDYPELVKEYLVETDAIRLTIRDA